MSRTTTPGRNFVLPALALASLTLAACSLNGASPPSEVSDPLDQRVTATTPTFHADPPCAAGPRCLR